MPVTPLEIAQRLYSRARVHVPLANPAAFGDQHLRQYLESGFVAVENVYSHSEVEAAKGSLARLVAAAGDTGINISYEPTVDIESLPSPVRAGYVRKLMGFVRHDACLQAMADNATLRGIAARLVGEELRLTQDMALLKPAHVGTEKPWHQDTAYFLLEPADKVIGTWTALDAATLDNGCMHVVPGSHLGGPLPHYHDRDCQLPDDEGRAALDVAVPLPPGGVLFFSGLLHHGTPPNASPASRWALQYHYAALSCRSIEPAQHAASFHDNEGYAACADGAPGSHRGQCL